MKTLSKLCFITILFFAVSVYGATVTRYVNTGSSGGDGTTSATSGENAAYATLGAWEDAEDGIDYAGDDLIVYCAGSATDSKVAIADFSADSITIIGDNDTGEWDSTKYHITLGANYDTGIAMNDTNITLENMQIDQASKNYSVGIAGSDTHDNCVIDSAIIRNPGLNSTGSRGIFVFRNDDITIKNTIIYNSAATAGCGIYFFDYQYGYAHCYNNTITNMEIGIYRHNIHATDPLITNCAVFNNTDDFSGQMTITNCATDEGAGTGTNGVDISGTWDSTCFTDTDGTGPDWSIQDADSPLYNAGSDLSGTVDEDCIDIERPQDTTYDIGAFEFEVTITNTGGLLTIW